MSVEFFSSWPGSTELRKDEGRVTMACCGDFIPRLLSFELASKSFCVSYRVGLPTVCCVSWRDPSEFSLENLLRMLMD